MVGQLLFTGGKMSMMPYRSVFAGLLGLVLVAGVYVALRALLAIAQAPLAPRARRLAGTGCPTSTTTCTRV